MLLGASGSCCGWIGIDVIIYKMRYINELDPIDKGGFGVLLCSTISVFGRGH